MLAEKKIYMHLPLMKNHPRLILYVGLILLLPLSWGCSEPGYYISTAGSDDNPGTKSRPFKSIAKINSLLLEPGDAVFFKGGETFAGTISVTLPGTLEDSVFISTYGNGDAIINGGDGPAMEIRGRYFRLEGLHATGSGRKSGMLQVV